MSQVWPEPGINNWTQFFNTTQCRGATCRRIRRLLNTRGWYPLPCPEKVNCYNVILWHPDPWNSHISHHQVFSLYFSCKSGWWEIGADDFGGRQDEIVLLTCCSIKKFKKLYRIWLFCVDPPHGWQSVAAFQVCAYLSAFIFNVFLNLTTHQFFVNADCQFSPDIIRSTLVVNIDEHANRQLSEHHQAHTVAIRIRCGAVRSFHKISLISNALTSNRNFACNAKL